MNVFVLNVFTLDPSNYRIINVESLVFDSINKAKLKMKQHSWEIFCDNDGIIGDFNSWEPIEWDNYYYEIFETQIH